MDCDELKAGAEEALGRGPIQGVRLELLCELASIYKDEGVLVDGGALPLWSDCACSPSCWARIPEDWRPGYDAEDPWNGEIFLPWLGEHYEPHGVAVLGINLRNASGLYVEYEIAYRQLDSLENGRERLDHSPWAYRSIRSAAALLRSLARETELDEEDPTKLVGVLDSIARLQSVKCSPKDGGRSARPAAMGRNCPPRYLRRELGVLRPSVLISFGLDAWYAMEAIGTIDESVEGPNFSRSTVTVDDLSFEMFWLNHPSAPEGYWVTSHGALLEELRKHPLAGR
jgi:hypothetical protein